MAQAQFIGPTGAQLGQESLNQFMQGMQELATYGRFATEQNRLNKIEEIKNKTAMFLETAKRFGGGQEWLGFKQMASEMPEYFNNQLQLIGYDKKMAEQIQSVLASGSETTEEASRYLARAFFKVIGKEENPAEETQSSVDAQNVSAAGSGASGATADSSSGKFLNLDGWDLAASGKLGEEAKAAWQRVSDRNKKYEGSGVTPEEQGMGGPSRKMFFSPRIAAELLKKMPKGSSSAKGDAGVAGGKTSGIPAETTNAERAEIERDLTEHTNDISIIDRARKQYAQGLPGFSQLSPEQQQAGPVHGNAALPEGQRVVKTAAGTAAPESATGTSSPDEAFWNYMQNDPNIGSWKGKDWNYAQQVGATGTTRIEALKKANQNKYDEFVKNYQQSAPTSTPEVSTPSAQPPGTTPASTSSLAEPKIPSVKAAQDLAVNASNLEGVDLAKARAFSKRLQAVSNQAAYTKLAESDPEGAIAFVKARNQNEAFLSSLSMYYNPNGEIAYQRDLKSGKIDLEKKQIEANIAIVNEQIRLMPEEIKLKNKTLEVELAKLRSEAAQANSAERIAQLQLDRENVDYLRAKAALDLAATKAASEPVDNALKVYQNAVQNYSKTMNGMMYKGKLQVDETNVSQANIAIDAINAAIAELNAAGRASGLPWADYSEWSNVTAKDMTPRWQFWRKLGIGGGTDIQMVPAEKGTSPAPTPGAPKAITNPNPSKVEDLTKKFSNY